jgi:PAS domain S-box-containing protein
MAHRRSRATDTELRRLQAARLLHVLTWGLGLGAVGGWPGALAWVVMACAYSLLRDRLEALVAGWGAGPARAELVVGVLGCSVFGVAPAITAAAEPVVGPCLAMAMLGTGFFFVISRFGDSPRRVLITTTPFTLVFAWTVATAATGPHALAVLAAALIIASAVAFTLLNAHVFARRMEASVAAQEELVRQLEVARDQAEAADQANAESLARLRAAVDAMPAGVAFYDAEDRLTVWNRRYEQSGGDCADALTAGVTFRELLQRVLDSGGVPEAAGREGEWIEERIAARRSGVPQEQEQSNGQWFRFEDRALPDGGVVATAVDITELKRREASFKLLFEHNPAPMWVVHPRSLKFIDVNEAAIEQFGWSRDEFLSMTLMDVFPPEEQAAFWGERADKLEEPYDANRVWRYRTKSGGELKIRPYVKAFRDVDGQLCTMAALLDVTAQVKVEDALKRNARALAAAKRQAEAASRAKSDFLAMMSHELRTPMNGVLGMAHALGATRLNAVQRRYADTILRSGDGLMAVLNDILDLSKIEAGKMDLAPEPTDLRDLVERACGLWRPAAAEKGLSFHCEIEPEVPAWVMADPTRVRQILLNLLSNALKFTREGHVRVRIGGRSGALSIAVEDSGPGMTPEVQKRLFETFTQADAGVARTFGGTGLGLAISRRLARLMGGDIRLWSAPGEGAVFTVDLPLAAAEAPAEAAEDEADLVLPEALSILVAEDNPTNQAVLKALLSATGWTVTLTGNGAEALQALQAEAFDLVLMDVHMPVMDGVAAVAAVRRGEAGRRDVPIVALTADAMTGDRTRLLAAGFDHHVPKPIQPQALFTAIAEAVRAVPAAEAERRAG